MDHKNKQFLPPETDEHKHGLVAYRAKTEKDVGRLIGIFEHAEELQNSAIERSIMIAEVHPLCGFHGIVFCRGCLSMAAKQYRELADLLEKDITTLPTEQP